MIVQATGTAGAWLDAEAVALLQALARQAVTSRRSVGASLPRGAADLVRALDPIAAAHLDHLAAASTSASSSASTVATRMKSVDPEVGMSTAAVAARFTVSESLVSSWVREGQLEAVGGGGRGRSWIIDPASVEALAQRRAAREHQHP